jgi:probable rRNA maturation factor
MAGGASAACQAAICRPGAPLATLEVVEATIVSDVQIGKIHGQFFGDPTPTDVITFQHGEILIGADTVAENAARYGHSPDDEAALCVIHGLLHLAGWDDLTTREAKQMAEVQEQIFKSAQKMIE